MTEDPRIDALPDSHGHAKGEHKSFADERPIPYTARMLFLWFFHACRRGAPRFMMVADHINYLTFEDPAAVHVVRRALKLAQAGDLYGAAETAGVELGHASVVSEGLRKGMRYSIGAEVDNDPRSRPDAQNIVDAMRPDGLIRSVHFLPITHPQHGENWMWPFDNPEFKEFFEIVGTERVWEIYMETLIDAIEKQPGHIVGHFYVPAKFGHWPDDAVLETYEDRLIDACAERGMAVEINSRYLYKYFAGDEANLEKFRTAHVRLMRKAKAKGVMIAVGSDAHSPRDQRGAFEQVLALLDEADVNEIAFPLNDRLARVALRATEEILRQHSAALAAPAQPRARAGTPTDPIEDDGSDDDGPRVESPNEGAEIILPPERETEPESEPVAAAPEPRPQPKPRKSRAKPKAVAEPAPPPLEYEAAAQAPESSAAIEDAPATPKRAPRPKPAPRPKADARTPERPPLEPLAAVPEPTPEPEPEPELAPVPEPVVTAAPVKAASKKAPSPAKKAAPEKAVVAKKAPPPASVPASKAAPKKAAAAKPTLKKATPKKAAAKKAVGKKTSAKKPAPKKVVAKRAPAKKAVAKRPSAKKGVVKKSGTKKVARKSAPASKRPAAKRPASKPAAKKTAKKKTSRR